MKTFDKLWNDVVSFGNLYEAFLEARKGKRFDDKVLKFSENIEENLIQIQNHLIWKSWEPGRWSVFTIFEPKRREINAPPFADRIVHHALVRIIEPFFERRFVDYSFACRAGKGTHAAVLRLVNLTRSGRARWGDFWCLKCDIRKCFPSINHNILKMAIRRTIRDPDVLWLCDKIIDVGGDGERGIPIGALTSQLWANVYMDILDHFVMDDLGQGNYCRYMDDFLVIGRERVLMESLRQNIERFLSSQLGLELNERSGIFKGNQGVDFCGYRIWPTHVLPRKRNVTRARRRLTRMVPMVRDGRLSLETFRGCLASFRGYMKHCNGWTTERKILEDLAASGRLF